MDLDYLVSLVLSVRWWGWRYTWWLACSSAISWCVSPREQLDSSAIKVLIMFWELCITYSHVAQHQMEPLADTLLSSRVLKGPSHIFHLSHSLPKPLRNLSFFCGLKRWKGSILSGGEPPALFQLNSLSQSVPSKQKGPPLCYKGKEMQSWCS